MSDGLGRFIRISLAVHAALATLIFVRAFFAPSEPLELREAIRVDIVGLPQKMAPDQPLPPEPAPDAKPVKPSPAPAPPPEPAPKVEAPKFNDPKLAREPKPNSTATKASQEKALERLNTMRAFDKLNQVKPAPAAAPAPVAGHQVTKGNSLSGIERLDYDRYGAELKARVLANWRVDSWLAEAELSARVRVWLDDAGRVTKKQISKSSGNEVFDAAALAAVDASDPFPAPPAELRGVLAAEGFTLGLPK